MLMRSTGDFAACGKATKFDRRCYVMLGRKEEIKEWGKSVSPIGGEGCGRHKVGKSSAILPLLGHLSGRTVTRNVEDQ